MFSDNQRTNVNNTHFIPSVLSQHSRNGHMRDDQNNWTPNPTLGGHQKLFWSSKKEAHYHKWPDIRSALSFVILKVSSRVQSRLFFWLTSLSLRLLICLACQLLVRCHFLFLMLLLSVKTALCHQHLSLLICASCFAAHAEVSNGLDPPQTKTFSAFCLHCTCFNLFLVIRMIMCMLMQIFGQLSHCHLVLSFTNG